MSFYPTATANLTKMYRSVGIGVRALQLSNTKIIKPSISSREKFTWSTLSVNSQAKVHMEALQKQQQSQIVENTQLDRVQIGEDSLYLSFCDGTVGRAPFLWMRDNCQCSSCFDRTAQGRKGLLQDFTINAKPQDVSFKDNVLTINWNDGHISQFTGSWFHARSFNSKARTTYRANHKIEREPWGRNLSLDTFNYSDLLTREISLLNFLTNLEKKGIGLVKNTIDDPDAGASLIDHIAFVKKSHYGRRSPVVVREIANNVAWSSEKLGLHNDLTQYEHQAGIIFIQTVKQHVGKGGESTMSDGLLCSEILRLKHPKEFELLSTAPVYFWDKGMKTFELEMDNFYKISKHPIIGLDAEGNLETLRMNNQTRDSHLDLDPENVNAFYRALMLFNQILYENSYSFKMSDGDILVLDNVRCLHGREGFESSSSRHLESAYLDWDEARCRRRRLQQNING